MRVGESRTILHYGRNEKVIGWNNRPANFLTSFTITQLLQLRKVGMYAPQEIDWRILDIQKESETKLQRTEQPGCNYSSFTDPFVSDIDLQFGHIPNHYEIISVAPGPCHREGSEIRWIGAWGTVGKHISEVPAQSLSLSLSLSLSQISRSQAAWF